MPIYTEKICDMCTLLKYVKNAETCDFCHHLVGKTLRNVCHCDFV